jgi:hypothetical protein
MSDDDIHTDSPPELDRAAIDRDIAAGAKAFKELLQHADLDWNHWSATILGLRGLRSLAFARARTNKMTSQTYRDAMGYLLGLRTYSIYDQIDKQTRSDCYRLMDRLEDVDTWYSGLDRNDKLKWKHPTTIAKHCPKEYLSGGMRRHNLPKPGKKKPAVSAETERLKALLMQAIEIVMDFKPEAAKRLLAQVHPANPDDKLDDL